MKKIRFKLKGFVNLEIGLGEYEYYWVKVRTRMVRMMIRVIVWNYRRVIVWV
jgi:hypothetical protein